jgi:hypothetical protein
MGISFKAVFDVGKPYEECFSSIEGLKIALERFYRENEPSQYPYDIKVYAVENGEETDISETQLINEMVEEIISEVQK